jgi:hypothetical protein
MIHTWTKCNDNSYAKGFAFYSFHAKFEGKSVLLYWCILFLNSVITQELVRKICVAFWNYAKFMWFWLIVLILRMCCVLFSIHSTYYVRCYKQTIWNLQREQKILLKRFLNVIFIKKKILCNINNGLSFRL